MLKIWSIIIILVTQDSSLIYGVMFLQKPQNLTVSNFREPFFFNCSTDVASNDGIDWVVRIKGIHERICSSKDFNVAGPSSCQLNYSMEVPNNRTLNLIVDPRIASLGDEYCCQFDNGAGKKSCSYLTISPNTASIADPESADVTTVIPHKTITDLPKNEVVLQGSNVLMNCAHVRAFRWYRYLPTDLSDDKVIYMGSKMAYDADERFRVYTEPEAYPYNRLDLYISNVRTDLFGTYKCQQPGAAHCAEIVVLESEPVCDVHLVRKLGIIVERVELTCRIEVSENAEPELLCRQNTTEYQRQSVCSRGSDGVVTCTAEVAVEMLQQVTCTVKFNPKPLQKYATCLHVSNPPSYTFRWVPSYDHELLQSNSARMVLISCLIIIAIASSIMLSVLMLAFTLRLRCVRNYYWLFLSLFMFVSVGPHVESYDEYFVTHSTSSSSCSTESDSLRTDSLEKPKILYEHNICIVNQKQLQKEVENGKLISYSTDIPD